MLEVIPNLRLHICPAAGDDGQAVGAAFHAYKKSGKLVNNSSKVLPYLGISYTNNVIKKDLDLFNLKYTYYDDSDLCRHLAQYIYCNKIVAIVRGRSEFGPRALCHRSILANPTWEGMKDHLNKEVKHREYFRPFAPVVIEEEAYKIFDLKQESPYMLLACRVKDEFISKIPSVTHIDKTARVQTVSKIQEPFIHDLLLQFEKLSGVPVLLNTSFN
ncbi:carbamoyltransferase C-terminal domain-containing protein, partial [Romboutsia ilealis]|uniref:carbamoyltransferase C-terminal domain-containing protein n=1 Tax=Romboutsia ilealis TaxID=1115758 RepID=UPI0026F39105